MGGIKHVAGWGKRAWKVTRQGLRNTMRSLEDEMIQGVYAANVTPFKDDDTLAVDVGAYLDHVSWLGEKGVRGVVPFGTNGEGPSVSMDEKLHVLRALFNRQPPVRIIPTIMQVNLPDTLQMVRALNELPAEAILVLPPYYFKPADADGLKQFYEPVFRVSEHPVIAYHIPKYAVPVPLEVVRDLPFWGVKDSSGEDAYTRSVLEAGKGVLIGTEDDLWARLATGAQGAISALANFMPDQVVALHEKVLEGDATTGESLSRTLQGARARTKEYASPAVLKRLAQERHGAKMGAVRPPFVALPEGYDAGAVLSAMEGVPSGV